MEFMEILRGFFRGGSFLRQFFPLLKHFPDMSGLNLRKAANAKLRSMFIPVIEDHKRQVEDGVTPDDFIGRYLEEMKSDPVLDENQLLNTVQDLFGAGSETVSSTLAFSIMYLVMHKV